MKRAAAALIAGFASLASANDGAAPDARHGRALFETFCVACHGVNRDGCGPRARLYTPRPANLTRSKRSDDYKLAIITNGGPFVGRSPSMPPWGEALSQEDIADIVAHLAQLTPREAGC